jgi:trehalose 6-phosphate synthase
MNLVAKEYVATRFDNDGVLVLSEFAGASDELRTALRVNPHDIEGLKEAILQAKQMPRSERARRMRAMRKRVQENDVARWSSSFLAALATPSNDLALPKANARPGQRSVREEREARVAARAEARAEERATEEAR